MNICQLDSYDALLDEHEAFVKRIEALSDFSIWAGAEHNDESIYDFALSYLMSKHKEVVDKVYADFEDYEDENSFEDFHTTINTKDKEIILTFIELYFSNIPKSIREPNFYGLINECVKEITKP